MHKITGFVHQDSLVYETLTVREALDMSVKLRCDRSLSATEQKRRIADSLHVLHLSHVANTVIGNSLKRGISGGEKKRVCVGMELITEPVVLFLDEPTTGLDALAAYQLVETLHNLALLGRTVVLTIHQPSSEMLEFIDDIFFMAEGRVLYAGPTNKMMDYFSQYDISCPAYSNPIDYLFLNLFYVETDEIDEYDDYASDRPTNNLVVPLLQNNENATPIESIVLPRKITVERRLDTLFTGWSKKKAQLTADIQDEFRNSGLDWTHYRKQKASFFVQYKYLIRRGFYDRIRNPSIVGLRLVQVLGAAMLIDIVYWQITTREQSIQIMDRGRYIFFLCSTMITQFAYDTATTFCLARKLFMREYRDGYFGVPAFFLSMITVETPLYAIIGVIYGLATYFAVGMPGGTERILTFCGICALIALAGMMVGVVVSCMTNKYDIVSSIASIFTITMMMFGGLFSNLGAIPAWIRWLEWVSPVKYGFAALLQNSSKDYNISCGDNPPSECQPIPAFASVNYTKLMTMAP
ncbi:ABC-2 type transporter-domain-containing protein [Syncephalis fuscata]|nr:ABC-2 type transporter-domain-containing protein [Syncephalis fuscata]